MWWWAMEVVLLLLLKQELEEREGRGVLTRTFLPPLLLLLTFPIISPAKHPAKAPVADTNCAENACFFVNPCCSKIAKSPTSCGISWNNTASIVENPAPVWHVAPIAKPSVKLCTVSASMLSHAPGLIC